MGPTLYFQTTGTHRIRVQVREDGLSIDQIVLSPSSYLNTSPGTLMNDTTILTKSTSTSAPPVVQILKPNAPESLSGGSAYDITWTMTGTSISSQTIQLSLDGGLTWVDVITGLQGGERIYTWKVPNTVTKKGRIRVRAYSGEVYGESMSASDFIITQKLKPRNKKAH